MVKIILCSLLFLVSNQSFAVKGNNSFMSKKLEEASCLLKVSYPELEGKEGICSGVSVSENKIKTAKHCMFYAPSKIGQGQTDVIQRPFTSEETIDKSKISLSCDGKELTVKKIKTHDYMDLSEITVEENLTNYLNEASKKELLKLKELNSQVQCVVSGFGLNNQNEMGNFGAIIIDDLKFYSTREANLEVTVDSDFKQMSRYFANSFFSEVQMDQFHFPSLIMMAKKRGFSLEELRNDLKAFHKLMMEMGLKDSAMFRPETGPKYKKQFLSFFKPIYQKIFKQHFVRLDEKLAGMNRPLFRIITNVENETNEKAGIDYGDSGGAFTCMVDGQLKLVGINSRILTDSNLGYIPRPWEPMHSRPKQRMTKNGEVTPLKW